MEVTLGSAEYLIPGNDSLFQYFAIGISRIPKGPHNLLVLIVQIKQFSSPNLLRVLVAFPWPAGGREIECMAMAARPANRALAEVFTFAR